MASAASPQVKHDQESTESNSPVSGPSPVHPDGFKTTGEQESGAQGNEHQDTEHDSEENMVHLLSQLQLPRMSLEEPPTLRILAVADIDLASAAALAEYSLNEKELGAGNVDLCIACGPFVRDEDVRKRYLQGRSKWRQQHRAPQDRTREETAALEGLMTAALSQLESIVCRLVFCPHPTDPSTTIFTTEHLRLTPNSVNVHQRWLQLAPGIGCSGYAGITDEQGRTTGPDRVHVQHGPAYANTLLQLLELGPPSSPLSKESSPHDIMFTSHISQAILVTQTGTDQSADDSDTFDWPKDHLAFLDSSKTQTQVMLNVASAPPSCAPSELQRGNVRLVVPGSLREHGDFAIIDVALHKDTAKTLYQRKYSWRVDRVQFRNMKNRVV